MKMPGRYQSGLTLVELMICIAPSLFVALAATALLLSTKAAYVTQDEGARIQDTGRYAIELITRAVRQAGYENRDTPEAPFRTTEAMSANITGLDARRVTATSNGIESPRTDTVNGSDVLAVRFFGAGTGEQGDGTMVNCAGFGVPAPTSVESADEERGWSIFYVAAGRGGPQLYCKYKGSDGGGWTNAAIASGVESFQVLYGVDTDGDSVPNRYLNANAIKAAGETHWKRVVVVKVALLVRGSQNSRSDGATTEYNLFGSDYAEANADTDRGTRIREATMPDDIRSSMRKIFSATIQVRNRPPRAPA